MADNNVQITINADDQASPAISKIKSNIADIEQQLQQLSKMDTGNSSFDDFINKENAMKTATSELISEQQKLASIEKEVSTAATQAADSTDKSTTAHQGLFSAVFTAELAVRAITTAYHDIIGVFQDSVKAATASQLALSGLSSTAQAFGGSADTATAAAKKLTTDGLLTVTDSASALKNLLSSGLNLDQATQLMDIYKDRAAFGRQSSIDYGQAVQNLAESFKTQSSMIGNLSGMTENYNQIIAVGAGEMGKSVSSLTLAEQAQAKYLGTIALSNGSVGDAARYAETFAGQQTILATTTQNAEISIGEGLQPAITNLQKGFVSLVTGGMADTNKNLPILQGSFLALSTGVRLAMDSVGGFFQLLFAGNEALRTHSMAPLDDAWRNVKSTFNQTFADMDKGFKDIANGTNDSLNKANQALEEHEQMISKARKAMNEALASENSNYSEAQAARVQTFDESLQRMITDHQTKVTTIKGQLADETASFLDASQRREDAYNGQVSAAEDAHVQKVSDITQQITDARNQGLVVDGVLYAQADQKKIDKLQQSLDKENSAYTAHLEKLKKTYDNQVEVAQIAENKKISALQKSLSEQEAILQAHNAEVAKYGNQAALDDITTLERKFAQEDAKALDHHNDSIAKIKQRAYDQGVTAGESTINGTVDGIHKATPALSEEAKKLKDSIAQATTDNSPNQNSAAFQRAQANSKSTLLGDFDKATGAVSGLNFFLNLPVNIMSSLSKALFGFADGGVISRPTMLVDMQSGQPYGQMAEAGPEAIVPMGKMGAKNSANYTFNNYGDVKSDIDMQSIFREFGFMTSGR